MHSRRDDENFWERQQGRPIIPSQQPIYPPYGPPANPRPPMNHSRHRDSYFYTILFLNNYFSPEDDHIKHPIKARTLYVDLMASSNTDNLKWISDDPNKLYFNHQLNLPITLEVWNNNNQPLIYAPIIADDVNSLTVGGVTLDQEGTEKAVIIDFTNLGKPVEEEVFKIGVKELTDFHMDPFHNETTYALKNTLTSVKPIPTGLAIVFRRNSLESLYDLIADFDDHYFHTLENGENVKYLAKKTGYKDLHFTTIFTNELQDVVDLIDVYEYRIEYSWEDYKKYNDQNNDYSDKYGYR